MARIKNIQKYNLKSIPSVSDTVIGSDNSNNGKTVQFPVSAFLGGSGGVTSQNNIPRRIKLGLIQGSIEDLSVVSNFINNFNPSFEIFEDEIVYYEVALVSDSQNSAYYLLQTVGKGKGVYGIGGNIQVLPSDFIVIEHKPSYSFEPLEDDLNAEVQNLGEIGSNSLVDEINNLSPTIEVVSGTNWYFEFTRDGERELWGFQGANGVYGLGGLQVDSNDLFLVYEEASALVGGLQGLQSVTSINPVTKDDIIILNEPQENLTRGYYSIVSNSFGSQAFVGVEQKTSGVVNGVVILSVAGSNNTVRLKPNNNTANNREFNLPLISGDLIVDAPNNNSIFGRSGGNWVQINPTAIQSLPVQNSNGLGYALVGRDEDNYGSIGLRAIDLSWNTNPSATYGATGQHSFCAGVDNTSSGDYSYSFGQNSQASGFFAFAGGSECIASGDVSVALGSNATASGDDSFATGVESVSSGYRSKSIGHGTVSSSFAELALGSFNTIDASTSSSGWSFGNRLLTVGYGQGSSSRKDALTILKNGQIGIGISQFQSATTGEKLQVDGTVKASNLTITNIDTYPDDASAGVGGLNAGQIYKTPAGVLMVKL